jgi:hypothetical protein
MSEESCHQAIKHNSHLTANRRSGMSYQPIFGLEPALPGATVPSSGSVSPGTAARLEEPGCSVITSLGEAQAEIRKAIAKNEAAGRTTRLIMGTNLIRGKV